MCSTLDVGEPFSDAYLCDSGRLWCRRSRFWDPLGAWRGSRGHQNPLNSAKNHQAFSAWHHVHLSTLVRGRFCNALRRRLDGFGMDFVWIGDGFLIYFDAFFMGFLPWVPGLWGELLPSFVKGGRPKAALADNMLILAPPSLLRFLIPSSRSPCQLWFQMSHRCTRNWFQMSLHQARHDQPSICWSPPLVGLSICILCIYWYQLISVYINVYYLRMLF